MKDEETITKEDVGTISADEITHKTELDDVDLPDDEVKPEEDDSDDVDDEDEDDDEDDDL